MEPAEARERRPYPELLVVFDFFKPPSEFRCLAVDSRLALCARFTSDVEVEAESGLGGKLLTLAVDGGAGNCPMLEDFLSVFAGVGRVDDDGEVNDVVEFEAGAVVVLNVGTDGVEFVFTGFGVGNPDVVTDLVCGLLASVAIDEAADPGRDSGASGMSGKGFLVFAIGSAGKGAVGGAVGGGLILDGRWGMADVMVVVRV